MRSVLIAIAVAACATAARAEPARRLVVESGARLAIEGTSTVRDFTCRAPTVGLKLTGGALSDTPLAQQLSTAMRALKLDIASKDLDCDNDTMNEHMLEALRAKEHDAIRFVMTGYELGAQKDANIPLRVTGRLTLAGQTRPVTIEVVATPVDGDKVRVEGRHALTMTQWGVKPPRLMFGAMKVGETVNIRIDLTLARR